MEKISILEGSILIVEDNPVDLDLAMRAFGRCELLNPLQVARDGEEVMLLMQRWEAGEPAPNVILLHSPQGKLPPKMPRSVSLPCNLPARAIHLLSGVSGWGHAASPRGTVSLIVRLHYADGQAEDHALKNGEQFANYRERVDVPGSRFAFDLDGRQVRYLAIEPKRKDRIERIEFVKGPDDTAPIVMAVTVEPLE